MVSVRKRIKVSVILIMFILSVCTTAKLTSEAIKKEFESVKYVSASVDKTIEKADEIVQFRTERQQLRQMQKAQLNDIIYNSESDGKIVLSAQEHMLKILEAEADELTVEGILKMRGFEDAIVAVGDNSVNVLVRSDGLTEQDTAVIFEHILKETGISPGNVKIIPIN